jgi:hypothetical protein
MPLRHVARSLLSAALASAAGLYCGTLLFGWIVALFLSRGLGEALAMIAFMPFAALIGAVIVLPIAFPTAVALAASAGGLLWQLGRGQAWARCRKPWLAVGSLCGLAEALRLVAAYPWLPEQDGWLCLALPAAAAGAAAALVFRAAMPLLPPHCDGGEDGGWEP